MLSGKPRVGNGPMDSHLIIKLVHSNECILGMYAKYMLSLVTIVVGLTVRLQHTSLQV